MLHGGEQARVWGGAVEEVVGGGSFPPQGELIADTSDGFGARESVAALQASDLAGAIGKYQQAAALYQGDFMSDDLGDDWPVLPRERLRIDYLDTLDRLSHMSFANEQYAACITLCQMILAQDNCREDVHCRLIRCYSRQDQYHLALRQYQACLEALDAELGVAPAPATTQLYERIRRHEVV